jgi:ankyrin repeat protein
MKACLRAVAGACVVLLAVSCGSREDAAATDLGEAGYAMTQEDWFRAAASDDVAVMKRFVSGRFDPASAAGDGRTALHVAAGAGAVNAADYLLSRGLPVDAAGPGGCTPLMEAVLGGHKEMVNWLLRQGADPRLKDQEGYSALMLAVREGQAGPVQELAPYHREALDSGLLLAAMLGRTEVIDTLTNYGASVYTRMEDGRTPLMLAVEGGHFEAVELLLDLGSSRFAADNRGRTAMDVAKDAEGEEIAALLARPVRPDDLSLESPAQLAEELESFVAAAVSEDFSIEDAAQPGLEVVRSEAASAGSVRLLRGETFRVARATTEPSGAAAASDMPSLVMRHYRQRELPVTVRTVDGAMATLTVAGRQGGEVEVQVREGDTIPGSRLKVVGLRRQMRSNKVSLGELMDVSVVEVRDPVSGEVREWIAGMPADAHDPVALLEDAATGGRYLAAPGDEFQSADGTRYVVSDVRPNQVVIENRDSGAVETIPLRGPRG